MRRSPAPNATSLASTALTALFVVTLAILPGCGGGGSDGAAEDPAPEAPAPDSPAPEAPPEDPPAVTDPDPGPDCSTSFGSTFEAIQEVVFERRGCTAQACHGSAAAGGLDLSPDVAYANLYQADSAASELVRVFPGTKERSFLWWKLLAAIDPTVDVAGAPMPLASGPLSDDELELVRLWVQAGAPEEGTVLDSEALVDGCLPEPEPIIIEPLEAPEAGEGVQLVMPGWPLRAASEDEVCFATWFDFSDDVPEEFIDESGNFFLYDRFEIRQDPSSHHLLIQSPIRALSEGVAVDPSMVEGWACLGGESEGQSCDPLDEGSCGAGACASPVQSATACTGYSFAREINPSTFAGTQQAQFARENHEGVFSLAPIRGLIFWNSHAFNLTSSDTRMNGRANFRFAKDRRYRLRTSGNPNGFAIFRLMREGAAPYTEKVMCNETTLPQGANVTALGSHTHKRGVHFWYELSTGEHIYDSFVYNDPLTLYLDPPMVLDQEDPAERTLKACSLFNNGVNEDGSPNPETVTRASRIPYGLSAGGGSSQLGLCEPTRCVNEGMYDVDCDDGVVNQAGDDAACDSSPGAGDGWCDACQIMGGVTTENEMFGPNIGWFLPED